MFIVWSEWSEVETKYSRFSKERVDEPTVDVINHTTPCQSASGSLITRPLRQGVEGLRQQKQEDLIMGS